MNKLTQAHILDWGGQMDDNQRKQADSHVQKLYKQREERLRVISRLVRTEKIDSQSQLRERLAANGVSVGQTTLSRDLETLGVVKVYGSYYAFPRDAIMMDVTRSYITNVELIRSNVIIRTRPTAAPLVAKTIETIGFRGFVGATLGNDTVNVICRNHDNAAEIAGFISNYIEDEPIDDLEPNS